MGELEDKIIGYVEIMEMLKCSRGKAYYLMKQANELMAKDKKKLDFRGKTTLKYFLKVLNLKNLKTKK